MNIFKFFALTGAAHRASEAIRGHKSPSAADLKLLGLPAKAFKRS